MDEQPSAKEPAIEASTGRVAVIDILRGLAILWVMTFHLWIDETGGALLLSTVYGEFFDQLQAGELYGSIASAFEVVLGSGYQGVQIFMMLSGMSLVMNAYKRGEPPAFKGYRARFGKILPAYWAGIMIFLAAYTGIAVLQVWRDGDGFHDGWWTITLMHGVPFRYELADIPWALSVFGPLVRDEGTALVGALWFVPLLLQYYLLFPLLLPVLRRLGPWQFALIGVAVTVIARTLLLEYGDVIMSPELYRRTLDTVAPFRIANPVAAEGDPGLAAKSLGVLAQGRDLERLRVDHQGDGAMIDAGGHALDAGRPGAADDLLGQRRGRDVDVACRDIEKRIADGAADHAGFLALAIEQRKRACGRPRPEPGSIRQHLRLAHFSAPGISLPSSIWAGT